MLLHVANKCEFYKLIHVATVFSLHDGNCMLLLNRPITCMALNLIQLPTHPLQSKLLIGGIICIGEKNILGEKTPRVLAHRGLRRRN